MSEILFIDAAYPPGGLYGARGLCFYAGGDTPHVWSDAEVKKFGAEYLLPIWVRSNPAGRLQAVSDAAQFIRVLVTVYRAPRGSLVALDSETSIDPGYVESFVTLLNRAGYPVIDYGSQSTVFGNRNPDGYYWGADWTSRPHIYPGDSATQYVSFKDHDLSEFSGALPLWDTRRISVTASTEAAFMMQGGWKFCVKCACLVHRPEGESMPCAGGGVHQLRSHNYIMVLSDTVLTGSAMPVSPANVTLS